MGSKNILMVLVIIIGLGTTSCKKKKFACSDPDAVNYDSSADYDDGSCEYEGSAVFWTLDSENWGDVDIYVNEVLQGTILKSSSSAPSCNSDSVVTFTAEAPETYTYSYKERPPGTRKRTAYISLKVNQCISVKLY